jgi:hypothetical protein
VAQQTIVAHFDSRADAQKAVDALVQAGIAQASVSILPEESGSSSYQRSTTTSSYDREKDEGGFLASLGNMFMPEEDRYTHAEGMSRGGATVSVRASDDAQATRGHGPPGAATAPVDLDERRQSWRSEGWSGHATGRHRGTTGTTANLGARGVRDDGVVGAGRGAAPGRQAPGRRRPGARAQLRGRDAGRGAGHAARERVHVDRRPVDRPVRPATPCSGSG